MSSTAALNKERKYLEDLLTKRFNFFFAFAGAVATALTSAAVREGAELWVSALLLLAALISVLFWRALFRTHALVREIISLTDQDSDSPLTQARKAVKKAYIVREANHYIAQWIPGIISLSFATGAFGILLKYRGNENFDVGLGTVIFFVVGALLVFFLDYPSNPALPLSESKSSR